MGLSSRRVYFDSCIVIYLVEEHSTFAPVIESLLISESNYAELVKNPDIDIPNHSAFGLILGELRA